MNDVEPKDRDIAMVFQSYALYPHMTVYDNMAFALKLRKMPKDEIDRRVREAAAILDITQDVYKRQPFPSFPLFLLFSQAEAYSRVLRLFVVFSDFLSN